MLCSLQEFLVNLSVTLLENHISVSCGYNKIESTSDFGLKRHFPYDTVLSKKFFLTFFWIIENLEQYSVVLAK